MRDPAGVQMHPKERLRFGARLLRALPVSFAGAFTFAVFGPIDLITRNGAYLPFAVGDILPLLLLAALGAAAAGGLLLALPRGKAYGWALSLAAGLVLAGYVQGTFMNQRLGPLTGDAVDWARHTGYSFFNAAVWCALMAAPPLLYRFARRVWKRAVTLLAVLLIGMQGAALAATLLTAPAQARAEEYLSTDGLYEVSSKKNIIVFLLDRLDTAYIDDLLDDDPYALDGLTGFTYYPNNISQYCRTYPAVTCMLTGKLCFHDTPAEQYFEEAWTNAPLLTGLRDQGYTAKLYLPKGYAYSDAAQFGGLVANVASDRITPKTPEIMARLAELTAYRYAPFALKPWFWLSTQDFQSLAEAERGSPVYREDDPLFMEGLAEQGITTQDETGNFAFYHLAGCHYPIDMNELGERVPEGSVSLLRQIKGCFTIVDMYLQWLKDYGLYDDATIIITGDHGYSEDSVRLDWSIKTALFYKPAGSAGEALAYSDAPVSHINLVPTLLDAAGADATGIGQTYGDIPEDAVNPRRFFYRADPPGEPPVLEEFEIQYDPSYFDNWEKIGETEIRYK